MIRRYKRTILTILCLVIVGMTGCKNDKNSQQIIPAGNKETYQLISNEFITDKGMYEVEWDSENPYHTIYYIDNETAKMTVLCQRVNCQHNSDECLAIAKENETMGCIFGWNGKLYFVVWGTSEERSAYLDLYSMKGDGTDRKREHTFEHAEVYPNMIGIYQNKLFLSVQTMQKLEDGSGETVAEPSIIMYDLETKKEHVLIDGTKEKGKYTVPCGGSGDYIYISQISWEDNDLNDKCTYLKYNFKTDELETVLETTRKNSQNFNVVDDTVYLQTKGNTIEKYNLKTKEREVVLMQEEDIDVFFLVDNLLGIGQEELLEEGGKKWNYNWYDLEKEQYLFDDYQDSDRIYIYRKTENGYFGQKDGEVGFYYPDKKNWKMVERIK